MSHSSRCQYELLAKNPMVKIELCTECRCVSLHLGPFSLRLDLPGLEALTDALNDATDRALDRDEATNYVNVNTPRGLAS